jgi:hypothetical protein
MGPGIGVRGRAASAAPKVETVFSCEAFSLTRESRDRYKYVDAHTISIRSAGEIEELLRQRGAEAQRAIRDISFARHALRTASVEGDRPPPVELVRRVHAVPPLRAVPAVVEKVVTKEAIAVVAAAKVKRAPAKGTMKNRPKKAAPAAPRVAPAVLKVAPANDNALANVPHKRDEPAPAPRRRTGGLSYLKLLASQELIEDAPQHAAAM